MCVRQCALVEKRESASYDRVTAACSNSSTLQRRVLVVRWWCGGRTDADAGSDAGVGGPTAELRGGR